MRFAAACAHRHSLLKIALLLGVQIRFGAKVSDLADLRASERKPTEMFTASPAKPAAAART